MNFPDFSLLPGDCDPGFYCDSGANTSQPTDGVTGNICPAGTYCPMGTSSPLPCPDGKSPLPQMEWQEISALQEHTAQWALHLLCPAQMVSLLYRGQSDRKYLPTGTYCPMGTSSSLPCPDGKSPLPWTEWQEISANRNILPNGHFFFSALPRW